jgi:hypothetical protein
MEVVPTGDGDEDGVVWFRCPDCQGFLPKLGDALAGEDDAEAADPAPGGSDAAPAEAAEPETAAPADDMPWDSPADMIASRSASATGEDVGTEPAQEAPPEEEKEAADEAPAPEPVAEYAALLAEKDPSTAEPYRPWQTYEVGQCVHHLAWDDCGVVVAKEDLPGGRHVIKCYFSEAGVVRLIEQAPR